MSSEADGSEEDQMFGVNLSDHQSGRYNEEISDIDDGDTDQMNGSGESSSEDDDDAVVEPLEDESGGDLSRKRKCSEVSSI